MVFGILYVFRFVGKPILGKKALGWTAGYVHRLQRYIGYSDTF